MGTIREWERLCAKYESAQDDNTVAYLAITARLLTGGSDGRGPMPTAAEVARWDVARARLVEVDRRMRAFVAALQADEGGTSSEPRPLPKASQLH